MKRMSFVVFLFVLVIFTGCSHDEEIMVSAVDLNQSELNIKIGDDYQLISSYSPSEAILPPYSWTSSNPEVVSVSDEGFITAVSLGKATITVSVLDGKISTTCEVTVSPIAVESLSLDKTTLSLLIGSKSPLKYTLLPVTATNKEVKWNTADESIATVKDGVVTAVSEGTTTITLSTADDLINTTCEVIVNPIAVESISFDKTTLNLLIGSKSPLKYTLLPVTATNKEVKWNSADESIATVKDGVVTAISEGTTTITLSTADDLISATCEVIVNPVAVTSISLDQTSLDLINGKSQSLNVVISPLNATNKKVVWSSSNVSAVTVDKGIVTGQSVGESTITATTVDGSYTATCLVHVKPIPVTGISLNKSSLSLLVDDTATLTSILYPDNAANKKIKWSSSDKSVATVNNDGFVNAISLGTTTITATTEDGHFTSDCIVKVVPITSQMKLVFPSLSAVYINGFIIGDVYSDITNESSHTINLIKLEIIDSSTHRIKGRTSDGDIYDNFGPGCSSSMGGKLNSVYKPIFKWYFTYKGETYTVQHQYK